MEPPAVSRLPTGMSTRTRFQESAGYVLAAIIPLLIVFHVLDLWSYDFSVPLNYRGDSTIPAMYAKAVSESGWYTFIDRIGMPTGFILYDYPNIQTIPFAVIRFMSLLGIDGYPRLVNWYFIITISLTAVFGYFVLRRLGVSIIFSLLGGITFTLLPYHFMKGVSQLELTSYFIAPLAIFLSVGLHTSEQDGGARKVYKVALISPGWLGLFSCVLIGFSSVYYVFFSVCAIGMSGIAASVMIRHVGPATRACVLICIIAAISAVNYFPVIVHRFNEGDNPLVAERNVDGSLQNSFTLGSLFIPQEESVFEPLRRIQYTHRAVFRRKGYRLNPGSYMGIIGILGVGILTIQFLKAGSSPKHGVWHGLAFLFFGFLLLGYAGGFGYLFSLFITPLFRGWERCVGFIAFPPIVAVMLVFESLIRRFRQPKIRFILACTLFIIILPVIVEDQMGPTYRRGVTASLDPAGAAKEFRSDELFFSRIESLIAPGGMILQLPHTYWPESDELNELPMHQYDHVRAYLHSRHARWSFPAMRGTPGELWARRTSSKPISEMLESLVIMDFDGIYLDRWGYPDSACKLVDEIRIHTETNPYRSEDGRMIFFPLRRYARRLKQYLTPGELDHRLAGECVVHTWFPGGDAPRKKSDENFWCSSDTKLRISNISSERITVEIGVKIESPRFRSATILITGEDKYYEWKIPRRRGSFSIDAVIPPGSLDFRVNALDSEVMGIDASRVFKILNSEIRNAEWMNE